MQEYNIDRDGDLKKADQGFVYLVDEVDAEREKDRARIAELEKALSDTGEFICRKCGIRQENGEKHEPTF